ncbi:MAG TPA: trypsin-like peptidase domain-containing protein [Chthonomonadales bacterium]|nr:trypsin-like peptidase domain-containing protein [Chthonomonadales bacterium]
MVKRTGLVCAFAVLATVTASAAGADSILKQMQREIEAIVARANGAVVTIEDERALSATIGRSDPTLPDGSKNLFLYGSTYITRKLPAYALPKGKPGPIEPVAPQLGDYWRVYRSQPGNEQAAASYNVNYFLPKAGTGFSIGDGYVLTTADVLEGMKKPIVLLNTGTRLQASIVGINSERNVGLLKLDARTAALPALKLGDSSAVRVGDFAISIGNLSGQDNCVALMMVGGIKKDGTYSGSRFYPSLIQMSGSVGTGSSGAPLLDADGNVIGMLVGAPAAARFVQESLIPAGTLSVPAIKAGQSLPPPATRRKAEPGKPATPDGALVSPAPEVRPDSNAVPGTAPDPLSHADAAGTQAPLAALPGSTEPPVSARVGIATSAAVAGFAPQASDLFTAPQNPVNPAVPASPYAGYRAGAGAQRYINRSGNGVPLPGRSQPELVEFAPAVESAGLIVPINEIKPVIEQLRSGKPAYRAWLGIAPVEQSKVDEDKGYISIRRDVLVEGVFPDSPAQRAGLLPGDIITGLNGKPLNGVADLRDFALLAHPGDKAQVTIKRGGSMRAITIDVAPRPTRIKPPITSMQNNPS